jgi:hypothetical protein
MSELLSVLMLLATVVIIVHCVVMAARLNRKQFSGHQLRFTVFSLSIGLLGGGAIAVLFGWSAGPLLLLLGVAGWQLTDRRSAQKGTS